MILDIIKVLLPASLGFLVGISITPYITNYLYKNKLWKKRIKDKTIDGREAVIFKELHKDKEIGTPRMGGTVIWISTLIVGLLMWTLSRATDLEILTKLEFVSRSQTWIPFFTLIFGAMVGLIDDLLEIKGSDNHHAGGLSLVHRLSAVFIIGLCISLWFYFKLDVTSLGIPFYGAIEIGWLTIPLFIIVIMSIYSSGVIDGIDGLSGGVFAAIFSAYSAIAFSLNQIDLAAFSALMVGSILAFLWFNIPPARFYMSETGSMALTITIAVLAFMTDHSIGGGIGISVLPIIALPLVITTASVIIQVVSKKIRNGKKVFKVAPIHHHFEAIGWPSYKVTMRYWIFAVISAILGVIIALIG